MASTIQPTVIKGATDAEGREVPIERRAPRRIISPESSAQVRDLMGAVIDSENGQRNLKLDSYTTGGKTGTAQRADTTCRCYRGYVTSFIGFAPLDDPRVLTYVVISNPRAGDTGTATAGTGLPRPDELRAAPLLRPARCPAPRPEAHGNGELE